MTESFKILHPYIQTITHIINLIGISIVLWGFVQALYDLVRYELGKFMKCIAPIDVRIVRITLGTYLLVALEFMIVSDIIESYISRSFEQLTYLGVIVVLRTLISYFLGRELAEIQEHRKPPEFS